MIHAQLIDSPVGILTVKEEFSKITELTFGKNISEENKSSVTELAAAQLMEYFDGKRMEFTLELEPAGTEFQKKVWSALRTIPYGQTVSYGEIAELIGNKKAPRAVGLANNRNPISIIIPCHRVIGANGKLVGYGGGLSAKGFLLELEERILKNGI